MTWTLQLPGLQMTVAVTPHALARYGERVRPHLEGNERALHNDLARVVRACGMTTPLAPEWANNDWNDNQPRESDLFVHCGDICLVVRQSSAGSRHPGAVVTALTRGGISEIARAKRNGHRSRKTWKARKKDSGDNRRRRAAVE
jgi:hypothetical protein